MLEKYSGEVPSVFDLLGHKEVDLTAALGWTLTKSPTLLGGLLNNLGSPEGASAVEVSLEVPDELGRTDIELVGERTKIVLEAKRGWLVPGEAQLSRYADRFGVFPHQRLVSLSDSSQRWATTQLPDEVADVPVVHLPWDAIRLLITSAARQSRGSERIWLKELETYMGGMTSTRDSADQWVYCVVISGSKLGDLTFRQYIEQEQVYFHPFGGRNGWPKRPPNFICFRWGGRVRQVNRVQGHEVVRNLRERWPSISPEDAGDGPRIVYQLGPNIPLPHDNITTKGVYASARVWCLLDQLLIHPNLADAVRSSTRLTR